MRRVLLILASYLNNPPVAQWLVRKFTDRKVRGSNPTSALRIPLSRPGQSDSIPALVLPLGDMTARYRKGVTAERIHQLPSFFKSTQKYGRRTHCWLAEKSNSTHRLRRARCSKTWSQGANLFWTVFSLFIASIPNGQNSMGFAFPTSSSLKKSIRSSTKRLEDLPDPPVSKQLEHEAAWCSTFSCLKTSQTGDSAGFQQLEHEAAWCSTFSCLKTSQTGDSAGFQVSLSQKPN
ncbi:hypothetical protein CSKR_113521 [Clonorchis sinensis]|uniref:Uncharacterized protein n=1 Tax=Clonorchis sinensis TaxID=79923 RepID=A0A419Q382_CLOSI|nr:hypothetical protein CSKR_113521 [Clonorchis sinensis]